MPIVAVTVLDHVGHDVDVAVGGLGIRTRLVRVLQDSLADFSLHTRQADVEASLKRVRAVR